MVFENRAEHLREHDTLGYPATGENTEADVGFTGAKEAGEAGGAGLDGPSVVVGHREWVGRREGGLKRKAGELYRRRLRQVNRRQAISSRIRSSSFFVAMIPSASESPLPSYSMPTQP